MKTDTEKLHALTRIIHGIDYITVDFGKEKADIVIDGYVYVSFEDAKIFNDILNEKNDDEN